MNDSRLIELAIEGLQAKRRGLDEELAQLQAQLATGKRYGATYAGGKAATAAKGARKKSRKRTAAERKAHSERMKKIWAERKKAKK